jgi:hypothetical protein
MIFMPENRYSLIIGTSVVILSPQGTRGRNKFSGQVGPPFLQSGSLVVVIA